MGQKIPPSAMRLGINRDCDSVWFSKKEYAGFVLEDFRIREFIRKFLQRSSISRIEIKRKANQVEINIHSGKPGLVIGRGGSQINALREKVMRLIGKPLQLNVIEEKNAFLSAPINAESVAVQLEKRVAFRRAMKQTSSKILKAGAQGVKICVSGRLGGSEIARTEWYKEGKIPLGTFRSDIDYGFTEALTLYGKIGVKVWICRGELFKKKLEEVLEVSSEY
jgi:small subunit ribosomal protein S3